MKDFDTFSKMAKKWAIWNLFWPNAFVFAQTAIYSTLVALGRDGTTINRFASSQTTIGPALKLLIVSHTLDQCSIAKTIKLSSAVTNTPEPLPTNLKCS